MGALLFLLLLAILILWGLIDLAVYLLGKQTMSQWVITMANKHEWFCLAALLLILLAAGILIDHFELLW